MSSIEKWGPATWIFFHTLAEKVKPSSFSLIRTQLLQMMYQIASHLPCPECASHAKDFLSKMNHKTITTRDSFRNMVFAFHNIVNTRLKKNPFHYDRLEETYGSKNLINVYNTFIRYFHTRGNMQLIADSFHRDRLLKNLQGWIRQNIQHFNVAASPPSQVQRPHPITIPEPSISATSSSKTYRTSSSSPKFHESGMIDVDVDIDVIDKIIPHEMSNKSFALKERSGSETPKKYWDSAHTPLTSSNHGGSRHRSSTSATSTARKPTKSVGVNTLPVVIVSSVAPSPSDDVMKPSSPRSAISL